ncbi:hypothetical protein DSL92_06225 [Billgrantia gudaonensis]|uniref:Uncharacterized protein n=1 Tax=Billgrantia gudaonensis TaxID=376427 RepID=A0A432JIS0_9GAMM|nr:hypothetical protein DSL92_06225 [Halomonas gudaonensis]
MPLWIKATLALVIPVIGFASDQGWRTCGRNAWAMQTRGSIRHRVGAVLSYRSHGICHSSVIGADESWACNQVIAMDNNPAFLLLTYSYVCLWFLVSGLAISRLVSALESFEGQGFQSG